MQTIIFIETNKSGSSREGLKAAKRLGYHVLLLTGREKNAQQREEFGSDIDELIYMESFNEDSIRQRIETIVKTRMICAIISFIDNYVYIATTLSNTYCNTNMSTDSIKKMENKIHIRDLTKTKGYTPFYKTFEDPSENLISHVDLRHLFPLIVKTPSSNGSKNIIPVQNKYEFYRAVRYIRRIHLDDPILVEKYLDGPQFLVETVVNDGSVQIAAIVEQEVTKFKNFIITGYCISQELEEAKKHTLIETVKTVIQDLDFQNGTCHMELRYVRGKWMLVEVNPRISGGAMNKMIECAYGYNLAEQTVKFFLGKQPKLVKQKNVCVYTKYLTVDTIGKVEKVSGKTKALNSEGIIDVYIKPRKGQYVIPPRSMGHRYGYVMAIGDTKAEAKKAALTAAKEIKFHLLPC